MDYRRLKGGKIDVLLSWLDLRKAASTKTPVWVEMSEPSKRKEGWVVIPTFSGASINLGRFSIQKPKKASRFEFIAAIEVSRAFVSVFQAFLKTKVIVRTVVSSLNELSDIVGTQIGDVIVLCVEEPVDPMGDRCLSISSRFLTPLSNLCFGSADVWKVFEHTVASCQDNETKMLDILIGKYRERTFEPIKAHSPAHKKTRKKRAPSIWMEWEMQFKNARIQESLYHKYNP